MNVAAFSEFENDRQIQAHQLGLPRVILEGRGDVALFQRWFPDLNEALEFLPAERVGDGGGCTAVAPAVRASREDGIPAVGIVDRDSLHRELRWDILFSTDEEEFAREVQTEAVYTTSLWEVEAYLLRPELLPEWVDAQQQVLSAGPAARVRALERTLDECEALLSAIPYISSAHATGRATPAKHLHQVGHADLVDQCAQHLAPANDDHRNLIADIRALIEAVQAHAPTDPAGRLEFLLRYVDTKRLLARLVHHLGLRKDAHLGLAAIMSSRALRPAELEGFLRATVDRYQG